MYSTSVYYYIPRHNVVLSQGSSARRYDTVYAKNLTLHKGVKNKLQFQFLNQDQKPINLTGSEVKFRLISDDGNKILITKLLSTSPTDGALPLTGIAVLTVNELELAIVNSQLAKYSLEIINTGTTGSGYPIYTDDHSGARGTVQIVNSVIPNLMPSHEVTIPNHQYPTESNPITFYSSIFSTPARSFTMQIFYESYTGTVKLMGNTTQTDDWYYIDDVEFSYTNQSTTIGYQLDTGIHPFYRLEFVATNGDITKILIR